MNDGVDYGRVLMGENSRHVSCWMFVQDQGPGAVTIVGASKVDGEAHPLRYGSGRTHQLLLGDAIIRPRLVVATDVMVGQGLGGLVSSGVSIDEMLGDGEVLLGDPALVSA